MTTPSQAACNILRECANVIEEATPKKISLTELEHILRDYGPHATTTVVSHRSDIVRKLREMADREEREDLSR